MSDKYLEIRHIFSRPWLCVCRAYLAKYPHPLLSHVESLDTLERYVDSEGRLITTRVLTSSFLRFSSIVGFEQSVIDLAKQTIYLCSNNITHQSFALTTEVCNYSVGENDTTVYTLNYTAKISTGLGIFWGPLMNKIRENFNKGAGVLEEIMTKRFGETLN